MIDNLSDKNMASEYKYKVVKPAGIRRNMGWGFIDKLQEQIIQEADNGWDFHREIADVALVFRRKR